MTQTSKKLIKQQSNNYPVISKIQKYKEIMSGLSSPDVNKNPLAGLINGAKNNLKICFGV